MSERPTLTVPCPDCGSTLIVDAKTGKVLEHRTKGRSTDRPDFDSLLADLDSSKARAEAVFEQEMSALQDRGRLLDEKFKRAVERAEKEDDGRAPVRPWDLD